MCDPLKYKIRPRRAHTIEFVLVRTLMFWATETCDEEAEASSGKGSAGIDHLQHGQSVRPVGLSSAGRPPQNPRVDTSWEVISADALRCSGSADFLVVFPRELPFPRFYPWELRRELQKPPSLTEISLNYFPPNPQPLTVELAPGRGRSDHGEVL